MTSRARAQRPSSQSVFVTSLAHTYVTVDQPITVQRLLHDRLVVVREPAKTGASVMRGRKWREVRTLGKVAPNPWIKSPSYFLAPAIKTQVAKLAGSSSQLQPRFSLTSRVRAPRSSSCDVTVDQPMRTLKLLRGSPRKLAPRVMRRRRWSEGARSCEI
nr:uncharacterized protein LOC128700076 [Cherax quadricarinatus]